MLAILTFVTTIITFLSFCNGVKISFSFIFFLINVIFIALVSFFLSLPRNYKSFLISGIHNTNIEVIIGDMFDDVCDLVVPTNTCFDVDKESTSAHSIQGKFCIKYYNNDAGLLDKDVEDLLRSLDCEKKCLEQKNIGKRVQYPINTIITLSLNRFANTPKFHWIAINHSDNNTGVIHDSIDLRKSIDALWGYLEGYKKLRDLCLPMLGTGHGGQNEPLPDLVEYYIDSFISHSQKRNIVKTLKIYLYPDKENVFENYKYITNYLHYRSREALNVERKYPSNCF